MKNKIILSVIFCFIFINSYGVSFTGNTTVCAGSTSALSGSPAGGTWSSSNTGVATIGTDGTLTGVAAGTCSITYTVGSNHAVQTATIGQQLTAITGPGNVCVGFSTDLSCSPGNGRWTSSNTAVATIGSVTGTVTGVSTVTVTSTATITYTRNGCVATTVETVNPNTVPGITGITSFCEIAAIDASFPDLNIRSTTLSDAETGGVWSSSSSYVSVGSSGIVSSIDNNGYGTVTITYTVPSTCYATTVVTINPSTASITGTGPYSVCIGGTIQLSDAAVGGAWTSRDPSIAVVGTSGLVTGVSGGSVRITYTLFILNQNNVQQ